MFLDCPVCFSLKNQGKILQIFKLFSLDYSSILCILVTVVIRGGEDVRNYYMCKYYFNASHSFQGDRDMAHFHTFTLVLYVGKRNLEDDTDVKVVDQLVHRFLTDYEGRYLNDLEEFAGTDASIEVIGNHFYQVLKVKLGETAFSLYQLDVSDNPLSVYQVADRILLPTLNMSNSRKE
jgi:6-pyruvoyltetrahydropterin/6-carboxytetrahydropterin synthase